jgi:hypothetical protein
LINITLQKKDTLQESGVQEGLCLDNALNITPRISINDAAGPEAADPLVGGTAAPVRTPVLNERTGPPTRT